MQHVKARVLVTLAIYIYIYTQHAKRSGGMMLAMIPIVSIIQALPQTSDGPVEPHAALVTGLILAALSAAALRWLKPTGLILNWGLWTT